MNGAPLEWARGPAATGPDAQGVEQRRDSACSAADVQDTKLQSTYAALLALNGGYSLHELAGGSFLICKWGMHHHAADLAGVKAFLARLGVSI